jgi:hypothetical protein
MEVMEAKLNNNTTDSVPYTVLIATQQTIKAEIKDDKTLVAANRDLIAWILQETIVRFSCILSDIESTSAEIDE